MIRGIGTVRSRRIMATWAEPKIVREIMVFLYSHGFGTVQAVRIFKTHGCHTIQVMTENRAAGQATGAHSQSRSTEGAADLGKHHLQPHERTADESHIIVRIRWFAREI